MRNLAAVVGSLALLAGFAGEARATATIDLLWLGSGTSNTSVGAATDTITLGVYVTNTNTDTTTTQVIALSIDYSGLGANWSVMSFVNAPAGYNPPFTNASSPQPPSDSGTQVNNFNVFHLNPAKGLPAGNTFFLATIQFHKDAPDSGVGSVVGLLTSTDGILEGGLLVPASDLTFNSATLTNVPEPSTASLLVLGLGGLYAVGRRQRR